jgi:hypothetical protein
MCLMDHHGKAAQMGNRDAGTRVTDPELDEALARAIRLFISDAVEAGTADAGATAGVNAA